MNNIFFAVFFLAGLLLPGRGSCAQTQADVFCPNCNIILVSLDTLRADSLGTYGYDRDTSPNLDRLARRGAVFLNAYSHAPNTFPSHMSMFTSQYPWTHKCELVFRDRLAPETVTLPMLLKGQGYRTVWAAPRSDPYLSLDAGFKRGFDDFIDPSWFPGEENTVFPWLKENGGRKFFMFLHTYRIHFPYLPEKSSLLRFLKPVPPRYMSREETEAAALEEIGAEPSLVFTEEVIQGHPEIFSAAGRPGKPAEIKKLINSLGLQNALRKVMGARTWKRFDRNSPADAKYLRTLYDAGVFEADGAIGALYEKLEELKLADKTLLVITSDHGEEFLEHGYFNHNQLYRELLHVPLIFVFPGKQIGKRISRTAQSIDIVPTILEAAGVPGLPRAEGSSLLPLIKGGDTAGPDPLAFAGPWRGGYSVRGSRYTYIVKNGCTNRVRNWFPGCLTEEFYDRSADPGELHNIFSANKEAAAIFAARLSEKIKSAGKGPGGTWPAGISEKTRKLILDTGYW